MIKSELERAIAAGEIERVVFFRPSADAAGWEVWAYGPTSVDNRLTAGRGPAAGAARTYTSLDRAHAAVRGMGYTQMIEIDG